MGKISNALKTGLIAAAITFALTPLHSLYTLTGAISKGLKWYSSKKNK